MTDITIPREAIEAVRDELRLSRLWADPATARAACLAMLRAWPGMSAGDARQWSVMPDMPIIILPLTQENTNAE